MLMHDFIHRRAWDIDSSYTLKEILKMHANSTFIHPIIYAPINNNILQPSKALTRTHQHLAITNIDIKRPNMRIELPHHFMQHFKLWSHDNMVIFLDIAPVAKTR